MIPERWQNVQSLYHQALEREPAVRASFLRGACGSNAELLAEVQSLLGARDHASGFLEGSVLHDAARQLASHASRALSGGRVGRYEILGLLGAGGMGEVYRARDPILERDIALKILLPWQSGAATSPPQLLREAQSAAGLSHPNICTVHEVGSFEGCPYLAMEYIEGETLAQKLQNGPLPIPRVLDYGVQIARALAHAHERHVLHKDLKTANVIITSDHRVKVVDFGIARRMGPSGVEQATLNTVPIPRPVAGTPAYMSPEVLRGEPADVRSEVWTLGVVLYEMVSGQHPFRGAAPSDVVESIARGLPVSHATHIPPELRAPLQQCLAVNPAQRFQRVADLCAALERASTAVAPAPHRSREPVAGLSGMKLRPYVPILTTVIAACLLLVASVIWGGAGRRTPAAPTAVPAPAATRLAILPFRVTGPDDAGVLGIGLADSLITRLAGVRELRVRPTEAIIRFGSSDADATEVGRDLGVDYLLRGTVTTRGDSYDFTLQLIRVRDGFLVWGDPFAVPRSRLLKLEELIVLRVTRALNVPLTDKAQNGPARGATSNPEAHLQYVVGRSRFFRKGEIDRALEAFTNAVRLDPGYARAYAGLAHALARKYWDPHPAAVAAQYRSRAMRAAEHAVQLEPNLAEAHEALSTVYRYTEAEWEKTIEEAQKALELEPKLELPHHNMASAFYHLGLFDLSDQESQAGVQANPASRLHAQLTRARSALYDGRFSVAQQLTGEVTTTDDAGEVWLLAEIRFFLGDQDWSERTLERVARGSLGFHAERAQASLASVLAFQGRRAAAETWLRRLEARPVTDHHVSYRMATAYAQLARSREALDLLRRTIDAGFPCYPWFTKDPLLNPVRDDPAFKALMAEQRAEWEVRRVRYAPVKRAF